MARYWAFWGIVSLSFFAYGNHALLTPPPYGHGEELFLSSNIGNTFTTDVLAAHNQYRSEVGIAPLIWSTELASGAQEWAETLAAENRLRHGDRRGRGGAGENLASGTASAFSATELVNLWGREKENFIPGGTFPSSVSKTGSWTDVGHYTQIVWSSTTHLGCGLASNTRSSFLVCRYNPPGNMSGQRPY